MRPEIIRIPTPFGGIPIHGYGLMIVIGFLLGLWVGRREVRRRGLPDHFSDLAITMLLAGILGGRIFYFVRYYGEHFAGESPLEFLKIWKGGLVFYGGAIGGLIGAIGFLRWKKLPVLEYFDVTSLVAPIGMGFGRLGCFLNGCCYGQPCADEYPLGVVFPPASPAAAHHVELDLISPGSEALPVHPVQLYQAGHDLFLFVLMLFFFRCASPPKGAGMPLLLVIYGVGRFVIEGLRADNELTLTGLTPAQNLSVALVAVFGPLLAVLYLRRARGAALGPAISDKKT